MSDYLIQGETLESIGSAIRAKTGKTAALTPAQMSAEIGKLSDTSGDTVTAAKMLSGTTAHDKSGAKITGTIATKTASNMTASGATVTAPAGYYASNASKSVATATQATPSISVSSGGLITASSTQTAGYVSTGTKSATKQLTTQAAQTITPGTTDQTIAAGKYLTGAQTIKGDANLVPENIASGVSIFGVEGTMESGGGSLPYITIVNNTGYQLMGSVNPIGANSVGKLFYEDPMDFRNIYFELHLAYFDGVNADTVKLVVTDQNGEVSEGTIFTAESFYATFIEISLMDLDELSGDIVYTLTLELL